MKEEKDSCKYCNPDYQTSRTVLENDHFFANFDNHPVSPGHMKIVSKRHQNSLDKLSDQEMIAFRDILWETKKLIEKNIILMDGISVITKGKPQGKLFFIYTFI